jgi:signal transduction histidine kinase
MTLRRRLFLLVAAVVCLLVVGETLLVRRLAAELDREVATVVVRVGEELLSGFDLRLPNAGGDGETAASRRLWVARSEIVLRRPGEASPGAPAQPPPAGAARGPIVRFTTENEVHQRLLLEPGERNDVLFLRGPALERRLRIPSAPVAGAVERFESRLVAGTLALLAAALVAVGLVVHRATRPLGELVRAAHRVGAGELGVEVPVRRADEVGTAVTAFNAMSARLVALDRENRRLADAEHLAELGEVARGLAHTLRNPLNALGLAVERLAEAPDDAAAGELAERCRRQIRRIDTGLRSLLALASTPTAGAEPVDLAMLAREVALEALQDAGGRVRVEVDAPAPLVLPAVAAELKAIVQALVVNACEASPDGGKVVVRLRAAAGASAPRARLEVEDEGPGIAPELAARLFAPHVTSKPQGSGMGLYLAERLAATRYGGAVALAPRTPRGTCATLTLGGRREGGA